MEASAAPQSPLPPNLSPPNPSTPWHFSSSVFQRLSQQPSEGSFKKVEIQTGDPEFAFVQNYFQHNQPANRAIARVWGVHNGAQTNAFEGSVSTMEQEASNPVFAPKWESKDDPLKSLRERAHKRWEGAVSPFSPFNVPQQADRQRSYKEAKVLPMWHGSSAAKCKSIAESGFTFFGKHQGGAVASTDQGFFGSGIYFTSSARYAADIYSHGQHLLLAWVSMRKPYPIVSDKKGQKCSDMHTLEKQGAYENYNAHYIPVVSIDPKNSKCAIYYPCAQGEEPSCDELVVFHKSQTLPRFWVEICVDLPKSMPALSANNNAAATVGTLIDLITDLLDESSIQNNQKLAGLLNGKFTLLIGSSESSPLDSDNQTFFQLTKRLTGQGGKVNQFVANKLLGGTPQASSPPPTTPILSSPWLAPSLPFNPDAAVLKGHTGWVCSVAWSPDGRRLASAGGSGDDTIRL